MPRYFVNLADDHSFLADSEGLEFPDVEAVNRHAVSEARFLAGVEGPAGDWDDWRLAVTDEEGRIVLTVPISGADRPRETVERAQPKAA